MCSKVARRTTAERGYRQKAGKTKGLGRSMLVCIAGEAGVQLGRQAQRSAGVSLPGRAAEADQLGRQSHSHAQGLYPERVTRELCKSSVQEIDTFELHCR